ncbi:uracil-DNA glycosylase [bacterium]|nr:MAG: uracil-DNA glycosylase [bacterium]
MTEREKSQKLLELKERMAADVSLPLQESNFVFGEGSAESEVMFIGEAPGFHEDKFQRPFVGRAGKLLDKIINDIGWKREDVYISNIVKRRPPENRDPFPDELEAYRPYLTEEIEILNPKIIAPLGRYSMNYIIPDIKISDAHGKVFWWGERLVIPLYHPAAALRSTNVLKALELDFHKLKLLPGKYEEFLAERRKKQKENPAAHEDKVEQGKLF